MFYYIKGNPYGLYWQIIPKNGSMSVLSAFLSYGKAVSRDFKDPYAAIPKKIKNLYDSKDQFLNYLIESKKDIFLIILRDPYKRVVSAFLNKIVDSYNEKFFKPFFLKYGTDISKFQNNKEFYFDKFIEMIEDSKNPEDLDGHIRRQADFVEKRIFETNKLIVINLDNLYSEWAQVQSFFPKMPNLPSSPKNASASEEFCKLINFKHKDKILKIYKEDYDLFNIKSYQGKGFIK
jgi:hypothetical protein